MYLRILFRLLCACAATLLSSAVHAAEYNVGPGHPYATPSEVPWEGLQPGDIVLIHWRSTPYTDKWVIARQGTATAPITVRGVPNGAGEQPIIDGAGAATRLALDYWGEARAVIKIGGSSIPADTMPRYIVVENLDVRRAHPDYAFTDDVGGHQVYEPNAAAIWIEKGEHIILRNNRIHDSANGIFVSSGGVLVSRDITIERNEIYDNGLVGSFFTHNTYTEALGMTYQFNRFGPLKAGAGGNNLKDRSAGLAVRYNWIEGGNRQLDLVESATAEILASPAYRQAFVYGNILIEPAAAGNQQIVHFGGDGADLSRYRNGVLYFYNNTVVTYRTDRTTLFRLSTNAERADTRNNIFYTALASGSSLSLIDGTGTLDMANNWLKPGYVKVFGTLSGVVNETSLVLGSSPGFAAEDTQNFRLAAGSACQDAGTLIPAVASGAHDLTYEYVEHAASALRPEDAVLDIGAYEFGGSTPTPPPSPSSSATFVRTDAMTQGSWIGNYGADGYSVAGDVTKLPADVRISVANATVVTWHKSTQDVRALQRAKRPGRIAAAWTGATFTIDVTGSAGRKRQLAIYCVDWLGASRLQRFDVVDPSTGTILDSRSVSDFTGGRYLVWEVEGDVVLRVAGDSGSNAVVSGIFIR